MDSFLSLAFIPLEPLHPCSLLIWNILAAYLQIWWALLLGSSALPTTHSVTNNMQTFPLLLWYSLQHTRLFHISVPLHMMFSPPKMPYPTSQRGNLFKTLFNSVSVKPPWPPCQTLSLALGHEPYASCSYLCGGTDHTDTQVLAEFSTKP